MPVENPRASTNATMLGVSRATVYRLLGDADD
jgi:hypothetical protein